MHATRRPGAEHGDTVLHGDFSVVEPVVESKAILGDDESTVITQ